MPFDNKTKWLASLVLSLAFLAVSHPITYTLVNSITEKFGIVVSDSQGCPTGTGLFVHGLVFALLARLLMEQKM